MPDAQKRVPTIVQSTGVTIWSRRFASYRNLR